MRWTGLGWRGIAALALLLLGCSVDGSAATTIDKTIVEQSARAAVANFGAEVTLGSMLLACQRIDLAGNPWEDRAFSFIDLGGNLCGCPEASGSCKMESAVIEPPEPIGGIE